MYLQQEGYKNIDFKYGENRSGNFYSPNIVANKSNKLHLFDVKFNLKDKKEYLKRKWKFLSETAQSKDIEFGVVVPHDKVIAAKHLMQNNGISGLVVPM